eukprot:3991720-Prymnesium_polylepis.1
MSVFLMPATNCSAQLALLAVLAEAQEAAELQAERGGMWRVREALDVRRREGTVAAWDVLVRWAGRHED